MNQIRSSTVMFIVVSGLLAWSGCSAKRMPQLDLAAGSRGAVVLLPGIKSDCDEQNHCTSSLEDVIYAKYGDAFAVYTYPWYESCKATGILREFGVDCAEKLVLPDLAHAARNRDRGRIFATQLAEWNREHSDKELYVVAASGGGWLLKYACSAQSEGEYLVPEDLFERVVFVSTVFGRRDSLAEIARATNQDIFSYYSKKDQLLTGDFIGRFAPDAAGVHGFSKDAKKGVGSAIGVYQVSWKERDKELYSNYGKHCDAFGEEYAIQFLMPLLQSGPLSKEELAKWDAVK